VELLLAGADAIQVGTATFRDPRAPWKVLGQLSRWCDTHATTVGEIRQGVRRRVGGGGAPAPDAGVQGGGTGATVELLNEGGRDG
jgi:hypothetical protein